MVRLCTPKHCIGPASCLTFTYHAQDVPSEAPVARSEQSKPAPVAQRAPITATVQNNGSFNPFQPEELGAEVLAAFDVSWNSGVNGAAPKNGKASKVCTAVSLLPLPDIFHDHLE